MDVRKSTLGALLFLLLANPSAFADDLALAPGPCLEKRKQVKVYLDKARKAGIGTKPYAEALDRIENDVKSGVPEADIKKQVNSLIGALAQQVNNLKFLKVRPPGYHAVGGPGSNSSSSSNSSGRGNAKNAGPRMSDSEMESYMLTLVNKHRSEAGLDPVSPNSALGKIARAHAQDMATRNFFSHVNPDGRDPQDRANAANFGAGVMENIAFTTLNGPGTRPTDMADVNLMNSPPHRAAILNTGISTAGIGIAYDANGGIKVCQLFSR
ncbi:MAG: CAP domain-containing protein [Candidatus Melainabacteria bacterium]|nr:CAP domain-containing protein [Candidatus Melainabacteria bacterium]